jgi:predicted MFS family arabinose efflux permease
MSKSELRASLSLASIFGLRLLGMFIILPVFALWAQGRPGWDLQLAGIAIGAYGLAQALLQIPFGRLSDRYGRKPMLYLGLAAMAAGSFVCALGDSPAVVIAGRILQGVGAISGVAIAMAADLTRASQRTKAMAIIGSTIAAPVLEHAIGMHGIFTATGILALAAMAVARWVVPDAAPRAREPGTVSFAQVLRHPELARLNFGIFALHAVLMAMFVVVPVALVRSGLPQAHHWWVYLGAVGAGFVLMIPAVWGRAAHREKRMFLGSIATVAVGIAVLATGIGSLVALVTGLVIFFAGFNVLEAKLPALVSRTAPAEARGAATGLYSSVQFLGTFAGAALGGSVAQHAGFAVALALCLGVTVAWLAVAWNMEDFVVVAPGAARH